MKQKMTTELFIKRAKEIHGDKYDYSNTVFKGWGRKVSYYCKEHKINISQMPMAHLGGKGCRMCGYKKISSQNKKSEQEKLNTKNNHNKKVKERLLAIKRTKRELKNPVEASLIGGKAIIRRNLALNKKASLLYGNKYFNCKVIDDNYMVATCKEHGEFKTRIVTFVTGCGGCGKCHNPRTKGEIRVASFLKKNGINFKEQHVINVQHLKEKQKVFICDFYLPDLNTIIEYNGEQHYMPIEIFGGKQSFIHQKKRDTLLRKYCRSKNIKLIEIHYKDYDNIENLLKSKLKVNKD